jgi:hypothetical protein
VTVAKKVAASAANAVPNLRIITVPGGHSTPGKERALAAIPAIINALTKPLTNKEKYKGPWEVPKEPRIVFTGTLGEVQDFFYGDLSQYSTTAPHAAYTDGLPIIPPTEEAVKKMLAGTSHKPNEVIGKLEPFFGLATVEKIAINAVMAGCRPEYFPVCLAIAEIHSRWQQGMSQLQGAGGAFTRMHLVNGPIVKEIGLNSGGPAMTGPAPFRAESPANTTIGRFSRLMEINIARCEPGVSESGGIGSPLRGNLVIAEDNESSPWQQFSADYGYKDGESTISTFVGGWMWYTWIGPSTKTDPLKKADVRQIKLGRIVECMKYNQMPQGLMVFLSVDLVNELAKAGYTKQDIKKYLWENATVPVGTMLAETAVRKRIDPVGQGGWTPDKQAFHKYSAGLPNLPGWPEWMADKNIPLDTPISTVGPSPEWLFLIVMGMDGSLMMSYAPTITKIDKWR